MKQFRKKITKYLGLCLAGICLSGYFLPAVNVKAAPVWPTAPGILAQTAVLMEASTGSVLYEKEAERKMFPASTTKLMTALLAIEQSRLTDTVEITHDAVFSIGWDASRDGAVEGELYSMEDALYAILLGSFNEFTYAVAEHVGGGDMDRFIEMMNERAKELGCVNSNFMNAHGLHDASHYTCAYDLALVMKKCLEYPTFGRISNNYNYTLPDTNKRSSHAIPQRHKILNRTYRYNGVFAGKTGHTDEAGTCLVTAAERNGMTLICVVLGNALGTDDCYTDTMSLFDYGFDNFEMTVASSDENVKNAFPVLFSDKEAFVHKVTSDLSISETTLVLPKGAKFSEVYNKCTLTPIVEMQEGENVIGKATFYYADRNVGTADIIFTSDSYQIVDPAELYLREYKDTEEFDETQYQILAGTLTVEEEEVPDLRPVIIGYIIGIIVLLIGVIILIRIYVKNKR
jgi:D-alanyl-D-alanine carboxypeptidase